MIRTASVKEILDATELIAEYAAECSIPAIGEINPHRELYAAMEKSGMMAAYMACRGEEKIGFAVVLMPVLPHYSKKVATLESLFVSKAFRKSGTGRELMARIEADAKSSGCEGILYSSPTDGALERLMEASKRYQRTNSVFYGSL